MKSRRRRYRVLVELTLPYGHGLTEREVVGSVKSLIHAGAYVQKSKFTRIRVKDFERVLLGFLRFDVNQLFNPW